MSELLKKYESIDQSKLSEATIKILNRVKTITADFTADDAKNNDIAEKVMNEILKKNPDAVKIVKREPKAKPAPKKTHKAKGTHKAKSTHKATPAPATKTSNNNIMSVAKEIQKTGESWKDAMERAKQVLKERKEQNVQKSRTEMEKLLALVRTKKELQGFANSDIKRDSVRTSKVKGSRVVTREGFTSNQYAQNVPNKLGRKYWESRENRSDRLAPNYQKDMPLLARGGGMDEVYFFQCDSKEIRDDFFEDLQAYMPDHSKVKLGDLSIQIFASKNDDENLKQMANSTKGVMFVEEKFANGGSFAPNVADGTQFMNGVYAKGGNVFRSFYEGQSVLYPSTNNNKLDKSVKDLHNKFANKELVIEKIESDKPYSKAKVFVRRTGEKVPFDLTLNPSYVEQYTNGGSFAPNVADGTQFMNGVYKNGGNITNEEKLIKELHKLQRDLNSSRLSQYREGDTSQEEMDRQKERESKLARFYEVLETLRQSDAKFAEGGVFASDNSAYLTDPTFGDFQNGVMFGNGGSLISETVSAIFNPNQKRGKIETGFGSKTKEGLFAMMTNVNYSPEEITTAVFVPNAKKGRIYTEFGAKTKEGLHEMVEDMRNTFELGGQTSGKETIELKIYSYSGNLINSGDFVADYDNNTITFPSGRTYKVIEDREWAYKIQKRQIKASRGLKGLVEFIKDMNRPDTPYRTVALSFIDLGKDGKFELGGAFMMTDLAGHTGGGTGGLNSGMPLDGFSGTSYTGLVGETGAMSSGELFMDGGAMMQNQQVINDASQNYVITEAFGNPAQQLGMLAKGGTIVNQYEGRTAEDVWNNLTIEQRAHFLHDHNDLIRHYIFYDPKVKSSTLVSDIYSAYKSKSLSYSKLNKYVKQVFEEHIETGQYAYGGKTKSRQSMRELYIENIAFATNTRTVGVDAFAKEHNLTDSELSNLMMGLGRKMISQSDFITALVGNKNNPKQKQVVAFAKAGNAYKMADGGDVGYFDNMSEEEILKSTVVFDNNGESYDRYTVYTPDGSVFGMSEDARGFNQYVGEKSEIPMGKHLGKKLTSVPQGIRMAVLNRMKEEYANGGSFAPSVSDGTAFMDNAYFADGGVINGMLNKKIQKLAEKKGLTMDALGRDEYNKVMTQALVESLTDANFHDEAKQVVVKAEGKTKWSDDLYQAESFNPDTEVASFAREVSRTCEWDGDDILNAYYFITKMQGSKVAGMIDDLFLNPKPTQSSSKPTKYIDHDDIESVTLNVNGNFVTFAGKDFLNGANLMEKGGDLSKIATYFPKRDIVKVTLKNGDTIKPLNGYWLKKGSEPMGKKTTSTPPKTGKVTSPNYPDVNFNHKVVINGRTIHLALAKSYKTGLDDSKQYDFIDVDGNPMTGYGFSVKEALKQIEEYGNDPIYYSKNTPPKIDETKAHFKMDIVSGGKFEVFVDSNFVNQSQNNLPNTELKHYGFGDFYLQTPDGNIDFIRTSEEKQGFVGRTHKMKGSDELVLKLVNAMKEKGRFESTQIFKRGGRVSVNYGGHKSKENWGKNDLYEMYANSIDLDADLADYFKDYEKDFGTEQAEEEKKRLVETLKAGKIKYNDGSSLTFADGGAIGSGKNGYVAFYKGKQIDVYADTKYQAQKTASQHFKARKEYDVNVVLAELDGKPYVNDTMFADGGSFAPNVADGTQFMNGVYANGGETQGNNIDAELEDFDLDNLDDFETMQYNHFVKSSGKVGALQILINTVEGDYTQLSPELAELAEMQMSTEEYDEATRQMRFERDGYANGGGVSGKLESGVYRVGKPTKVSANLYEQKIAEIFDNGDISTASDYGRKLGDFKSQKYPIITKEQLENQYKMADGGSTGSGFDPVKLKVLLAVGIDRATKFYNADYPIRPYQLLERAVRGGYITLDEINERVVDSAMETAQDSEDMDEVGSSDFGAYLRDFLDEAGFKVGYVNGRLTREYADGGSFAPNVADGTQFMNNVYADGGEVRRFNRHEQMDSETREEILDIVSEPELRGSLTNYLYGLYDGYDYSQTERFKDEMKNLKSKDSVLHDRINAIYKKIDKYKFEQYDEFANGGGVGARHLVGEFNEQQLRKGEDKIAIEKAQNQTGLTYIQSKVIKKGGKPFMQVYLISNEEYYKSNEFADGGMFDDNDGFMRADNERSFRYPEREVRVDSLDESVDLTSNVSYQPNEVVIRTLDENIDLNDDNRIRARMGSNPMNRNPNKMMAVNPRMVFTDLPKPTSSTHKND